MISDALRQRIATQLNALALLLRDSTPERLARRPKPDTWSAHENLAHLARYQHMFLEDRLQRVLQEQQPRFSRYRAEDDPDWPRWHAMTLTDTLSDLRTCRARLLERLLACSDDDLARVGVHPVFGTLTVSDWVEFFLLHEAHHLYVALTRAR